MKRGQGNASGTRAVEPLDAAARAWSSAALRPSCPLFASSAEDQAMIRSPLMTVMTDAVMKASKSLKRDFGEVENLQVSR